MAGEVNGTSVLVAIEDSANPGSYLTIGGQTSHTLTLNNNPIDITNKSSASYRELLDGEGLQSLDLTLELQYNSDASYLRMRTLANSKGQANFRIAIGSSNIDGKFQIATFGETAPDNDKLTNSVSLQSSGAFTFA